jgi:histidinol-phosphate aminotransferase
MTRAADERYLPPPRPELAGLEPYVPGEQPADPKTVKLNTNEFPYPAAPEVIEALRRETGDRVRVYPNPTAEPLRRRLAERHGVTPERVIVGNGSDEILRLIVHAFGGPGRTLAIVEPTYSLFPVLAEQFATPLRTHALGGGTELPEGLFEDAADLCLLPTPNPPLGTAWDTATLERLAAKRWLLALDGAYVDFAGEDAARPLIDRYPNVLLTRTFSKSAGLAGMRVGYAIGDARAIDALNRLRDSYNVNRMSQAAAMGALEGWAYYRRKCDEIVESRRRLAEELTARGWRVHPSAGNFVFARHRDVKGICAGLKARGVLVRYFKRPGLDDGVRITIGTPAEIDALLGALDAFDGAAGGDSGDSLSRPFGA